MKTIITFGTFDIFHIGHLAILQRAKALGDRLVVGVSSDRLNLQKKQRNPIYSESERIAILRNIKDVDDVFLEESLEEKAKYIQNYRADILAMGDDWEGHFDHFRDICEVVYFPRTPSISTTEIIEIVRSVRR
ncbi:MAG: adenylyltransferase/cytidyltransferase family protein [Hafnia sp.]|uniref:adenylyltransferase/cytidyltransferase family protein n=1 Tax=Hafnia sp. TaxID=1873498 RepID=UPI0026F2D2FC|nr:adenylyltransferase/cytidyltransferase family protein [Hafnia alvei]